MEGGMELPPSEGVDKGVDELNLEGFDFSDKGDQRKFDALTDEEKSELISKQQEEANLIHKLSKEEVDTSFMQLKIAKSIEDYEKAEELKEKIKGTVESNIKILDQGFKDKVKKLNEYIPNIPLKYKDINHLEIKKSPSSERNLRFSLGEAKKLVSLLGVQELRFTHDLPYVMLSSDRRALKLGKIGPRTIFLRPMEGELISLTDEGAELYGTEPWKWPE